jgi:hypothetical protein
MPSIKERIVGAADCKTQAVAVPEWGIETGLFIRELSAADMDRFDLFMLSHRKDGTIQPTAKNVRALLVQMSLCDDTGKLVFGPTEVDSLGNKSGAVIDRLYHAVRAFNSMDEEATEKN